MLSLYREAPGGSPEALCVFLDHTNEYGDHMEVSAANSLRSEKVSGGSKSERGEHSERSELVE